MTCDFDGEVVIERQNKTFLAQIILHPSGTYRLWWTDYVVNEWQEDYGADLGTAILRLACLEKAVADDLFFKTTSSSDFKLQAEEFFTTQLS